MGMFDDLRKLEEKPFQAAPAVTPHVTPLASSAAPQPHVGAIPALDQPAPVKTIEEPHEAPVTPTAKAAPPTRPPAARADRSGARAMAATQTSHEDLNLVLAEPPYRKDTFLFTTEEFEAFEDLKLRLRRSLDVKVTKNDLARCAIAYLVAEVNRNGEASPIISPLLNRRGR